MTTDRCDHCPATGVWFSSDGNVCCGECFTLTTGRTGAPPKAAAGRPADPPTPFRIPIKVLPAEVMERRGRPPGWVHPDDQADDESNGSG